MPELCVIAPIGLHPRFVRVRPLRFRHDGGAIIARVQGYDEHLDRTRAIIRLRALDRDIAGHDRAGRTAQAVQARADRHDLDVALRELFRFRKTA